MRLRLCVGVEAQIGVLHRPFDAAVERDAEHVGEAEVLPLLAPFVVQRAGERGDEAAASLDVAPIARALRVGQRGRVGEDQHLEPVEPLGCEERLVHQLEGQPRLDQRVIHAEHVIVGAVAGRGTGVIPRRLFRVEQPDPASGASLRR